MSQNFPKDTQSLKEIKYSCIILKDGKPLKQKKFQTTPEDTKLFEQIKCLRINLENRRSLSKCLELF